MRKKSSLSVALVTGAGRGIGRAAAIALARAGYRLTLLARTTSELNETARLVGDESLVLPADVADASAMASAVKQTVDRFGRLDALVHCAGYAPVLSVEQTTIEEWQRVIEVNLSSAFYLARAAWPTFKRQKSGVIVNVSSFAARDPFPGFAAYASAKAGLHLLDLVLAREGAAIGVRVHTIAPAAVETAMFRSILSSEQFPADNTLDPAEVADTIVQCIAGQLRYTSGEVIYLRKQL